MKITMGALRCLLREGNEANQEIDTLVQGWMQEIEGIITHLERVSLGPNPTGSYYGLYRGDLVRQFISSLDGDEQLIDSLSININNYIEHALILADPSVDAHDKRHYTRDVMQSERSTIIDELERVARGMLGLQEKTVSNDLVESKFEELIAWAGEEIEKIHKGRPKYGENAVIRELTRRAAKKYVILARYFQISPQINGPAYALYQWATNNYTDQIINHKSRRLILQLASDLAHDEMGHMNRLHGYTV